ncbi:BglII/BstYI family type II restriction endonuclease, partial [Treponema lecithinolyticum]|uniref:BglII/BstYI family type II restriction endonuclease n=1 Tax=Treponema lecithinolyticum TaxID=53418 RepID=UPI0028E37872
MKIVEKYSHLNGLEFLLVHKPELWQEIETVIQSIDAETCKTKISKEKTKTGQILYSPIDLNCMFKKELYKRGWEESRVSYWVTKDEKLIRRTISMP